MLNKRKLFIGSSGEALPIANKVKAIIQSNFRNSIEVKVWSETKWKNLTSVLDNLTNNLDEFYYAVFICTPDDVIYSRKEFFYTSRDNVIFEFGLFLSRLGKERTFLILPNKLNYKKQTPLQITACNLREELEFKLLTDIGKNLINCRIDIEYILAKRKTKTGKEEKYDSWKASNLTSDISKLINDINDEEAKHKTDKPKSEAELVSRGRKIVEEIKLKQSSSSTTNEFFINKLLNDLPALIYARSKASEKTVVDTTMDIVELVYKFKDFLDIEQLARTQKYPKVKKVWVFADTPIEFDEKTKPEKKYLLQKSILENLRKGSEYTYIANQKFDVSNFDTLFEKLSNKKKDNLRKRIHVITVEPKHFKTFFTLHFPNLTSKQPDKIYMSALLPDRDDLLIQISAIKHYERIYERIKKLVGYPRTDSVYSVIDHVVKD